MKDYTHTMEDIRVPKRRITRMYAYKDTNHHRLATYNKQKAHTSISSEYCIHQRTKSAYYIEQKQHITTPASHIYAITL